MVLDTVGIQSKGCFSKQKEGQNNNCLCNRWNIDSDRRY